MVTCIICGSPAIEYHHLIGGTSNRSHSTEDGLIVPLCPLHHRIGHDSVHESGAINRWSKICGQLMYERDMCAVGFTPEEARKDFRERYGKSFL